MKIYRAALPLVLTACFANAQEAANPPTKDEQAAVVVDGVRNPDLRSYRSLVKGLDAFEEYHAFAPAAQEVRFKLKPRRGVRGVSTEGVTLKIVGNSDAINVPVSPDATFTLPRVQAAIDDDADLVPNRKKGQLEGTVVVRTPGLPDNVRRLGDVRLECRVLVGIAKNELNFLLRGLVNTYMLSTDWCGSSRKGVHFSLPLHGYAEEGTISYNGRTEPVIVQGDHYEIPLADKSWPDDALITLKLIPEPSAEDKAKPFGVPMYLYGSMNKWTPANRLVEHEKGVYTTLLTLEAGVHKLKVADINWDFVNLGGAAKDQRITPGADTPLTDKGKDLLFEASTPGVYAVRLDVRTEGHPRLSITRE